MCKNRGIYGVLRPSWVLITIVAQRDGHFSELVAWVNAKNVHTRLVYTGTQQQYCCTCSSLCI